MAAKRVAVVTGANKGVGFAVVRALCKKFDGDVILTSRDEGRGQAAIQELSKEGLNPRFHQLDISDHDSIVKLKDFVQTKYGGLDVLVNNAGLAYKGSSTAPFSEQAEVTNKLNFFATLDACEVLFPILRPHARVSNVSSMVSEFAVAKCSDAVKAKFYNPNITMAELKELINDFVQKAQTGKHIEAGYPDTAYGVSKIGVTVMSIIQQRELDKQGAEDIVVNACCPGFVDTDMTSHKGKLTIDEGAANPVYLALLPPNVDKPRGNFIRKFEICPWG